MLARRLLFGKEVKIEITLVARTHVARRMFDKEVKVAVVLLPEVLVRSQVDQSLVNLVSLLTPLPHVVVLRLLVDTEDKIGIMLGLPLTEEILEVLAEGGNVGEENSEAVMLPSFVKGALHLHLPKPSLWTCCSSAQVLCAAQPQWAGAPRKGALLHLLLRLCWHHVPVHLAHQQ